MPASSAPDETPILALDRVSKRFGAVQALDSVSLSVSRGEIHCLLGENGAGKSTLCNVIFGTVRQDLGALLLDGKPFEPAGPADCLSAGIAMVHQHFSVIGTLTVVENLMLGRVSGRLLQKEYEARISEISASFGLHIDPRRLVEDLSVGERQKVEIVKCLMRSPKLLVLDEPTAVLLPDEIDALLEVCRKVADSGCGVILVTHKLAEIAMIADRTTVMRAGRVVQTSDMAEVEVRDLVRAMIGRDLASLDGVIAGTLGVEGGDVSGTSAREGTVARTAEDALTADGLSFLNKDGAKRLDAVTLVVRPGEIVGLAGVEGNGQSELGAILAGLARPSSGRLFIAGKDLTGATPTAITAAGVGIIPEDRHAVGCVTEMSVAENLFLGKLGAFSNLGLLRRGALEEAAGRRMREFDVRAASPTAPMRSLSGGNQQKAVLARELSHHPLIFLLAAQPTRGLDVGAVEAVYNRLRQARDNGAGILLISSELDELIAVADRIEVIYRGRIVGSRRSVPGERDAIGTLMAGGKLGMEAAA